MRHKYILTFSLSILFGTAIFGIAHGASSNITYVKTEESSENLEESAPDVVATTESDTDVQAESSQTEAVETDPEANETEVKSDPEPEDIDESENTTVHSVPFYSQFTDISAPEWRKIGCGIASLAMLVDFYTTEEVSVDALLNEGIQANAYTGNAGWSHAGLIGLAKDHGLSGEAVYMTDLSMTAAFSKLEEALKDGPVMASVHYTFKPTNPIPHLVIVTGVENGEVHYNDPAEKSADGTVSVEQFKSAWKKRYIEIRG